jgi:hypothetical protein
VKIQVFCPNCDALKRVHDLSTIPAVKARTKLVQKRKAVEHARKAHERGGKKPAKRPGKFEVSREELGPDIDNLLKNWGRRMLAHGFDTERVHCACGGVCTYELDDGAPFGVKFRDDTPPEKRRGRPEQPGRPVGVGE